MEIIIERQDHLSANAVSGCFLVGCDHCPCESDGCPYND